MKTDNEYLILGLRAEYANLTKMMNELAFEIYKNRNYCDVIELYDLYKQCDEIDKRLSAIDKTWKEIPF